MLSLRKCEDEKLEEDFAVVVEVAEKDVALDEVDVAENMLTALAVVAAELAVPVETDLSNSDAEAVLMGTTFFGLATEGGRVIISKTPLVFFM